MTHEGFSIQDRRLGRIAAWTAFVLSEAYAIASGLGFMSLKSPSDAISDPYLSIMALLMVLMVPFLVVTMVVILAYAPPGLKSYARAALVFMILLAGTTSTVNFGLLVMTHQVTADPSPWLSLFLPYRLPTLAYAMDIFAWDWFFGLSMLCAAPVFRNGGLERVVRFLMISSGLLSLVGLIWLLVSPSQATIIGILGWGVAGPIVFLLIAMVFGRAQPEVARFPTA